MSQADSLPSPILRNDDDSSRHVFTCSLCCDIPLDPVMTPVCQHVFCRSCIRQGLENRSECPNDRQPLSFAQVKDIDGALRRVWEAVSVRCPKGECRWAGTMGSYVTHVRQCFAAIDTVREEYEQKIQHLKAQHERELRDFRNSAIENERQLKARMQEALVRVLQCQQSVPALDKSYTYNRFRVVELTQLICHSLESKPNDVDSNRIYNCVKCCWDDYNRGYMDNPNHLFVDIRMLIAVCLASTWFTPKQRLNMDEWFSRLR